MTVYGLTETGFVPKTLQVVREDINAAMRAVFGASIDLGDRSIIGQIVGIISERIASLWDLTQAVSVSQDPDSATGAALDALCILTGTFRTPASYSVASATLTGTPTTVVPALSQISTDSTDLLFETIEDATIGTTTAWAALTAYAVGDIRTSSAQVYYRNTAGTSGGVGGPSHETRDEDILGFADDSNWTWLGAGTGHIVTDAKAVTTGEVVASAYDLSTIETAVSGWDGVTNLLDAELGRGEATDAELRVLRELELSGIGNSTPDAIRAALLEIADVTAATVFYNNTDVTDGDGIPPHSVEALVRDGEDQDIWDVLFNNVAAGIRTYGNGSADGTSTDDEGTVHDVSFTRPTPRPIYIDIVLVKDPALYPADGDVQVAEAIVEWGDVQATGKNAVMSAISARAFSIAGVLDVTSCYIDDVPIVGTPTATIAISLRELATYDTGRISVVSTSGVP